jgi:hypothetical protein
VPDVECRVGKGSADVDRGAGNVIERSKPGPRRANRVEVHLSSGAAIHDEHSQMGSAVPSRE